MIDQVLSLQRHRGTEKKIQKSIISFYRTNTKINSNKIINVTSPGGIPLPLPSPRWGEDKACPEQ
jgi:hypothetical protein